jgi:P4 family phage/plasmid primase-like protien
MPLLLLVGPLLEAAGMSDDFALSAALAVQPDQVQIACFVDVVFGYCDGLIPIRSFIDKGQGIDGRPHNIWIDADAEATGKLATFALWAAREGAAVYVIPGTVAATGQARADDILQTQTVLVDLDSGDIAAKRSHLVQYLGPPTLAVASGGLTAEGQRKLHLYWRLTEPAEGDDIPRVCRARHMIATKVGGDRSFQSAHQPIRVAGTVHAKNGGRRLVEVLAHTSRDYDLGALIEAIVGMPPLEGGAELDPLDFNDATGARSGVTELFARKIREGGVDGETRFDALSRVIGYWIRRCRDGHVTPQQAWEEIVAYNAARIDPPWHDERLRQESERLWKRDADRYGELPGDGNDGPGGEPPDGGNDSNGPIPVQFTEDALADTFAGRHSDDWRYVAPWGQWLSWNGSVWSREDTLLAYDLARSICRENARRANVAKIRAKLSSAATVSSVERLARSDRRHASSTEVWDRDPWLLNTTKGVVELRSGVGGPHDPAHFMTKIAGAAPEGDCPTWREFLRTVTGDDAELQAYLQRMAGYCLTGVTTEHALFFLYGTGANGKSVFANTLTAILGDYAAVAPMDMFMATHGDRHPTDMAGLRGARIVISIETEQGSRWAESKLKALTGGDRITARFMRQDFFEFMPQFKLLVVGNHKPSIRNVDEAMKRRLHMVPFTVTIPPARRDKRLPDRLLAERDGILAWALDGCLAWQRDGLRPPPAVMAATEDYFEAEDAMGRWIEERCSLGAHLSASTAAMFADWKAWADANGEFAGSVKRFSEGLIARSLERHNTRSAKGFRGIALNDSNSDLFSGE